LNKREKAHHPTMSISATNEVIIKKIKNPKKKQNLKTPKKIYKI